MKSINGYLTKLAADYFISYGTTEKTKIDTSVDALKKGIKLNFGNDLIEIKTFGSYDRGTMLPRRIDSMSDVDIMIVFDHERLNILPESYRQKLIRYADTSYTRSGTKLDFPTVRVDLTHVILDLVPTIKNSLWGNYQIPDKNNRWMTTDPSGFTNDLESKNTNNGSVVKPVIRLLKAWNSANGYPYESFQLEKIIAGKSFWAKNIEEDFFAVIDNNLSSWDLSTQTAKDRLNVFKNTIRNVRDYLKNDDEENAKLWLHRVLPK
jgi:hypothetical protein